jgi:hypothetical protein
VLPQDHQGIRAIRRCAPHGKPWRRARRRRQVATEFSEPVTEELSSAADLVIAAPAAFYIRDHSASGIIVQVRA